MTIQDACRLLGVSKEDDEKTIKLKFRKQMHKYHPDAIGGDSPECVKKAQLLNEAYALLRKRAASKYNNAVKHPVWKAKIRQDAYVERTIYMEGVSWEGEPPGHYEVARGRYEWNPDLEEFPCFLKSLNEAALTLLEKIEYQNKIYNDYEYNVKTLRFDYQLQLFHLLARQFISPVSCLKKMVGPEETNDKEREIYKIQAFLGAKGAGREFTALSKLKVGQTLCITSLKHNRIMISTENGEQLGYLSLAQDSLYYVVIPILQARLAQIKFVVGESDIYRGSRPFRIKVSVELYLRMAADAEEVSYKNQNQKIGKVLSQYDKDLKD